MESCRIICSFSMILLNSKKFSPEISEPCQVVISYMHHLFHSICIVTSLYLCIPSISSFVLLSRMFTCMFPFLIYSWVFGFVLFFSVLIINVLCYLLVDCFLFHNLVYKYSSLETIESIVHCTYVIKKTSL
jgi:hypothetical protein